MSLHPVFKTLLVFIVFLSCTFQDSLFGQQFDVGISKQTITAGPVKYGTDIPYNITISNDGTDSIQNVVIRDLVGDGYLFNIDDNTGWSVDPMDSDAVLFTITDKIPPGQSSVTTLLLEIVATDDPTMWDNTAELVSFTDVNGTDRTAEDNSNGNNMSMSTSPLVDLALTKMLLTTGGISYGDTLDFRIKIYNQGNQDMGEINVVDLKPEGFENPIATNAANGWTAVAVNPMYTFSSLPVGGVDSIDIRLILLMDMADRGAWYNYAEISLMKDLGGNIIFIDADSDPNTNSADERTIIPGSPDDDYIGNIPVNNLFQDDHDPAGPVIYDLAIRKERLTGPPSYSYGGSITYSIDIFNQGNEPVQDVIFKDSLPCGIEDLDLSANPGWTFDVGSRVATFIYNDTIEPVTFERFELNLEIRPCYTDPYSAWTNITEIFEARDLSGAVIDDIDSQYDDVFMNDPGGVPGSDTDNILNGDGVFDDDDHDVEAIEIQDLAIIKTALTEGPYEEGDTIDFNIQILNQGNVEAITTYIEEFIPEGFRYEQAVNGPLGWAESVTIGTTTLNRIANTITDPLPAGDTTDIQIRLILELDGTVPRDWYNYAHVLNAVDSLGNNRGDDADSQYFNETAAEQTVIPGDANDDNIFTLGVNFGEDQDDHDPATITFYDLALAKTVAAGPYPAGQPILFTITVTNEGNQTAQDVEITDYIPCGLAFDQNLNASNMLWNENLITGYLVYNDNTSILPGQSFSVDLYLTQVTCSDMGAYTNVAEISGASDASGTPIGPDTDQDSTPDNDPTNDVDDDDIDSATVILFDLSLTKTFATAPISAAPGTVIDYIITITNEGTVSATNVVITDNLPCGLSFTSSAGWTLSGGELTYSVPGSIGAGTSIDIPLQVTTQSCPMGTPLDLTNSAEITNADDPNGDPVDDQDSTPDNNDPTEDDQDEQTIEIFDLALSKSFTASPASATIGSTINYTIRVTNEGAIDATNVIVSDNLPCGLLFTSSAGWVLSGGELTYTIPGTLAAGTFIDIPLSVEIQSCPSGVTVDLTNSAEITNADDPNGNSVGDLDSTPDNDDPNEDDQDDEPFDVFDLSLNKSFTTIPTVAQPGVTFDYTITVTNEGTIDARNVIVTEVLPCGLSFTSSAGWVLSEGELTYDIPGTIASGMSVQIPLSVQVQTCPMGMALDLTNSAEITNADDPNGNPGDDHDSTPDNDDPSEDDQNDEPFEVFDLSLEKTLVTVPQTLAPGTSVSYNITVTNEGTIDARNVIVTEVLPCGLSFTSSAGWVLSGGELTYTVPGTIASGTSVDIPFTAWIQNCSSGLPSDLTNSAEITNADDPNGNPGDDQDSTPDNNDPDEDDQDDATFELYDLSIEKTLAMGQSNTVVLGDPVVYNISITNEGNIPANNVSIAEYLPCGLSFVESPGWVIVGGNPTFTYTNGISQGEVVNITLQLITQECGEGVEIDLVNVAEISSDDNDDVDSTPGNNNPNEDDQDDENTLELIPAETLIGDFVFNDLDGDGLQDFNEPGIPDVVINVYDDNAEFVTSVTTDANGEYNVLLVEGGYYFDFIVPDGFSPTIPTAGNNPSNDSNVTGDFNEGSTSLFDVLIGQEDLTIDAGFYECVKIRGIAWYDINENDTRQGYENGINELVVNLYKRVDGNYIHWETTETMHNPATPSDDGLWEFCTIPGTFYVEVVMPPIGLVRARPFAGSNSNTDSDINGNNGQNTTPSFTLISGQSKTDLGAGYYPMATVGNSVWIDENGNGLQEAAEAKVENVIVEAYDENDEFIKATTTDSEGKYLLDYLGKDTYYLRFEAPEGYGFTQHIPEMEDKNSDVTHANGINTTKLITLQPGMEVVNVDAGLAFGALPVSWVAVDVTAQSKYNLLEWTTAQEVNNSHFIVERADRPAGSFIELNRVTAKNEKELANYSYKDYNPISGVSYYRLKQVDLDGHSSYSKVVSVSRESKGKQTIYPNPVSNKLNVSADWKDEAITIVRIYNNTGKLVKEARTKVMNGGINIDVSIIQSGVYLLETIDSVGTSIKSKFIKL